jgi:hypothetical protein
VFAMRRSTTTLPLSKNAVSEKNINDLAQYIVREFMYAFFAVFI